MRKVADAVAHYQAALESNPDATGARVSLGLVLEKMQTGQITLIGILRGRTAAVVPIRARDGKSEPGKGRGI